MIQIKCNQVWCKWNCNGHQCVNSKVCTLVNSGNYICKSGDLSEIKNIQGTIFKKV